MIDFPTQEVLASGWLPFISAFLNRVRAVDPAGELQATSWFRTPQKNRDVGGDEQSQHLFALALDATGSENAIRRAIVLGRRQGLIAVKGAGHVHLQLFPRGALERAGVTFPV